VSLQKIASSTLWQLASQGVSLLLGILSVKLVTLSLSKELVGNYQTAYGYLQIFGIIADFGLYAVSIQELSRARDRMALLRILFVLRGVVTILSLGAALLLAWIIPNFRGTPLPLGITIAAFVPFFTLLAGMFRTAFQVEFRMRSVFAAEIASRVTTLLLMIGAFLLGVQSSSAMSMYFLFLLFGSAGGLVLFSLSLFLSLRLPWVRSGLSQVFRPFSALDWQQFIRIARLALPYGFAFFATTIYRQTDITLIAFFRPDYELQNAYYGTMMRIAEVGFLLPTFLLNSALPALSISGVAEEGSDAVQARLRGNILLAILILGSVVFSFSFFWSRPIALLLTQKNYLSTALHPGADTALELLSFPMFLAGIVAYCFYLLLTMHYWRPLLVATSIAAAISVMLNIALIPLFGFVGAAIASIATHLLIATSLSALTLKYMKVYLPFAKFLSWLGFTISLSGLLILVAPSLISELWTMGAGALFIPIIFLLLRVFSLLPKL
jgi:PST family polysaccharide transporter